MRTMLTAAALTLLVSTGVAFGDVALLWNNYISQPDGYDHITARSSERDTLVLASWTADDVILEAPPNGGTILVEQIRWIEARDPRSTSGGVDFIILDEAFIVVREVSYVE